MLGERYEKDPARLCSVADDVAAWIAEGRVVLLKRRPERRLLTGRDFAEFSDSPLPLNPIVLGSATHYSSLFPSDVTMCRICVLWPFF